MQNSNSFNMSWFLSPIIQKTIYRLGKALGQLTLLSILLFGANFSINAQKNDVLPTRYLSEFTDDKPKKCFEYNLSLDFITQNTPADETIIVIARLGDKDTKSNLNKRRLHNIRVYWTQYLTDPIKRNPKTIVLAEGEPIKGFGQVEFYVRGEFVEILKLVPNGDFPSALCHMLPDETPCSEEKQQIFYPCKDKVRRQMPKQKIATSRKKR